MKKLIISTLLFSIIILTWCNNSKIKETSYTNENITKNNNSDIKNNINEDNINNNNNETKNKRDRDKIPIFIPEEKWDINEYVNKMDWTQDEEGDFIITGKSYQYDVASIKIDSDDKYIYFLIELASNLKYYFDLNKKSETMWGTIGKFLIDIDNDKNTGEEEIFTKRKGFEKELTIYVSTDQDYNYSVGYRLNKLPFSFDNRIERTSGKEEEYISIEKNYIEFKLSLDELWIQKQQKIRVMFREEWDKKSFSESFSDTYIKEIN